MKVLPSEFSFILIYLGVTWCDVIGGVVSVIEKLLKLHSKLQDDVVRDNEQTEPDYHETETVCIEIMVQESTHRLSRYRLALLQDVTDSKL